MNIWASRLPALAILAPHINIPQWLQSTNSDSAENTALTYFSEWFEPEFAEDYATMINSFTHIDTEHFAQYYPEIINACGANSQVERALVNRIAGARKYCSTILSQVDTRRQDIPQLRNRVEALKQFDPPVYSDVVTHLPESEIHVDVCSYAERAFARQLLSKGRKKMRHLMKEIEYDSTEDLVGMTQSLEAYNSLKSQVEKWPY